MATTGESIADGLRWCGRVLAVSARRAVVLGLLAGLFALAVIATTGDRVAACGDMTDAQQAALSSLQEATETRSFRASASPSCVGGMWTVPLDDVAGEMLAATDQLRADGWVLETEFLPHFDQLWRRCFRLADPGWEQIQVTVDATRAGLVEAVQATAPEQVAACELERRETSPYYPPRQSPDGPSSHHESRHLDHRDRTPFPPETADVVWLWITLRPTS